MPRKKTPVVVVPEGWDVEVEWTSPTGRHCQPGTEVKIRGQRGRFKFDRHVSTQRAEWIDVKDSQGRFRSFRPQDVRTVHRKKVLR